VALADRGAALADRGAALADRGAALADRGAALVDRGAALADRGATLADRGAALADRGAALADRGAGVVLVDRGVVLVDLVGCDILAGRKGRRLYDGASGEREVKAFVRRPDVLLSLIWSSSSSSDELCSTPAEGPSSGGREGCMGQTASELLRGPREPSSMKYH
jgi:hypothetical protein